MRERERERAEILNLESAPFSRRGHARRVPGTLPQSHLSPTVVEAHCGVVGLFVGL